MNEPTIVLVHGAFHDHRCFDALVGELESRGFTALAPDRPGHGDSADPLGDLDGDARAIERVLASIAAPVVLVGHSYGGAVISEVRSQNVAARVYLAAIALLAGESVMQHGLGEYPPTPLVDALTFNADGTITVDPAKAHECFYADCDSATSARAVARLQPQAAATFSGTVATSDWQRGPSTYVVCTDDRAIAPSFQRALAARCTESIELATSHSPFLSQPGRLAEMLAAVAAGRR